MPVEHHEHHPRECQRRACDLPPRHPLAAIEEAHHHGGPHGRRADDQRNVRGRGVLQSHVFGKEIERPSAQPRGRQQQFVAQVRGPHAPAQTYAIANRSRKISAGVSELAIRTFVETNVAPHTVTVNNAARWYLYSVYFIIRLQKYGFFCAGAPLFTFHLSLFTLFFYLCVLLCVMTIITTNNNNYFSLKCKVKVLLNSLRSCWLSRVFISSRLRSRRVA